LARRPSGFEQSVFPKGGCPVLSSLIRPSKLNLSFDAIFYYVTDMEAAIVFYRDTLGLPLISQ